MNLGERERPDGCVTDLAFDAWLAGELSAEALGAAEAHLAGCARCRERRAALAAERAAFLAQRPVAVLASRWRGTRWALVASLLSAVGALALVLRVTGPEPGRPVQVKGGPARIGFFVERGGRSVRGASEQLVQPGDRVRFVYTSEQPVYLAIYGRDASGAVSVYFPAGDSAQRISEGYDALLPSAVALDQVLGPETIYALFCEAGFRVVEPKKALLAERTPRPPAGCRLDTLTWTKGPPQ